MKAMVLTCALLVTTQISAASPFKVMESPSDMPEFVLSTHKGDSFTSNDLIGNWTLVLVGFTSCPDVCPYTLGNLEHVLAETASKVRPVNLPAVVFLAVDPARDTESLGEYVGYFHPDFTGVTGELDEINAFIEGIDAFYQLGKPNDVGGYDVRHSADLRVIDPDGRLHATIETPMNAVETSDFLLKLQVDYRRNHQ